MLGHKSKASWAGSADRNRGARSIAALLVALVSLFCLIPSAFGAAPDRAFEMVSPPQKNGNDVLAQTLFTPAFFPPIARSDGEEVMFTSLGAFPGADSNGVLSTFVAARGADGWSTDPLSPPQDPVPLAFLSSGFNGFGSDFGKVVVNGNSEPPLAPGASEGTANLYVLDRATGTYQTVSLNTPPHEPNVQNEFVGASDDLSKVVFGTPFRLTDDAPDPSVRLLYEWNEATDSVDLLGREPGTNAPMPDVSLARTAVGNQTAPEYHTVSSDGSKVFFKAPSFQGQLYVRLNGTSTKQLSTQALAVPADPNGPQVPRFWNASADGSVAFFSSAEKLTADATTGPTDGGSDLYKYDVATETLTDITVDGADPNGAELEGVLGASEVGTRVYFAAKGVLAPGGVLGQDNLYLWTDDGTPKGSIRFVSAGGESINWEGGFEFPPRARARTTADGLRLLFESSANLTGYNSDGHFEAYLYDAGTEEVTCASCNPSGDPATADAEAIGTGDAPEQARTLSADGNLVFFTTSEALSPQDSNGVNDVYGYDASTGQIDLISSGAAGLPSAFTDASADGSNVFFLTREPLVGIDTDENLDIYDARVGGGIPSQNPPPPSPPCVAQECQGPPASPPPVATPESSTFVGPGNPAPHRRRRHHHRRHHRKHRGHRALHRDGKR